MSKYVQMWRPEYLALKSNHVKFKDIANSAQLLSLLLKLTCTKVHCDAYSLFTSQLFTASVLQSVNCNLERGLWS
jgi:hypothetical protein